jgi:hypothetical protein
VLLPYASYLRIYQPAEPTATPRFTLGPNEPRVDTVSTLALSREQQTVLERTLSAAPTIRSEDDLAGCYVMHRDGAMFVCPVDLALRSWLATGSFGAEVDPTSAAFLLPAEVVVTAEREYAAWRAARPTVMPHIREATWGVPRTWFLLVAQEEREQYDLEGQPSVRFRAPLADARRRLLSAFTVLNSVIDDDDLLAELSDLGRWLSAFAEDCWLELDYAGVAALLGSELSGDRSAYEISSALRAIGRRDFARAGETYHRFVERWRTVNARERAS